MAFTSIPSFSSLSLSLSLIILFILLFFFITLPSSPSLNFPIPSHRSLFTIPTTTTTTTKSCSNTPNSNGILNYNCLFPQIPSLTIPTLSLLLILHFYILIKTASNHFSIITTKLASHLNLSPSMAAVTLLALGNGSPDVFSSLAALRSGQYRTGFGAILSAGAFVSALVVGFVAIYAAPFPVDPAPFVRDVLFYLTAAFFLFYVYLSAEIFLWQAVGFVAFYVFFVGFVFYMDFGLSDRREKSSVDLEGQNQNESYSDGRSLGSRDELKRASGFSGAYRLVCF